MTTKGSEYTAQIPVSSVMTIDFLLLMRFRSTTCKISALHK